MASGNNTAALEAALNNDFNQIGQHLMAQRPALFHYATRPFHTNPELMSREIDCRPEVFGQGAPLVSVESPLALLGTDGAFGVDYCFQITQLSLDLHPRNAPEGLAKIDPIEPQSLAMVVQICGGILCPQPSSLTQHNLTPRAEGFTVDLFATATSQWLGSPNHRQLAIAVGDIEIADLNPDGLSSALECYITTTLRVGIVPRIQIALESLAYELGQFATLALAPLPLATSNSTRLTTAHHKSAGYLNAH